MIDFAKYIVPFTCCFYVRGYKRSVILDVQRQKFDYVPNDLLAVITDNRKKAINDILQPFDDEDKEIFLEYIDFLLKNEYAFLCDKEELEYFPDINLNWDYPGAISNAIIEINPSTTFDFNDVLIQLEAIGCKAIELRIYMEIDIEGLKRYCSLFSKTNIESINLKVNFHNSFTKANLESFLLEHFRVFIIELFNCQSFEFTSHLAKVIPFNYKLTGNEKCGAINMDYFALNTELYTESQKHNSCLNRKISIDVNGKIKNCPNMSKDFGNINDISLQSALKMEGFKDYWNINKDKIDVCKDCEYRYICTDCRVYLKNPNNIYSQPLKCGYNPYIAKWKDEDGYVSVEKWRAENQMVDDLRKQ